MNLLCAWQERIFPIPAGYIFDEAMCVKSRAQAGLYMIAWAWTLLFVTLLGAIGAPSAGAYTYKTIDQGNDFLGRLLLEDSGRTIFAVNDHGAYQLTFKRATGTWTQTTLHAFCSGPGNCRLPEDPVGGLIKDQDGNLYGASVSGGSDNQGSVFKLTENAAGTKWTLSELYSFCAVDNCHDGTNPSGALYMDRDGVLFGTTNAGGLYGPGVVYRLARDPNHKKWVESVIYNFCPIAGCKDGDVPRAQLTADADGNLYGTTIQGGAYNSGTIFELIPNNDRTQWTETVVYSFCGGGLPCSDGYEPSGAVVLDAAGNIYGTILNDGTGHGHAYMFERASRTFRVIYAFCSETKCADGNVPNAPLTIDGAGNLYGTTIVGGVAQGCARSGGCGVAFRLTPNDDKSKWKETVLTTFCVTCNKTLEAGPVTLDKKGNIFGSGTGNVFELVK